MIMSFVILVFGGMHASLLSHYNYRYITEIIIRAFPCFVNANLKKTPGFSECLNTKAKGRQLPYEAPPLAGGFV